MNFVKQTLGERIRTLRESKKLSQQDLADMIPISQAALHRLESGESTKSGKMVQIAAALETTAEYLQTGKGFINESPDSHKIPILSWKEIQQWVFVDDKMPLIKDEFRKFIYPPKINTNSRAAYCLKIIGNSMEGDSSPSLNSGDYIIVDPEIKSKSGDFIIYNSPDSNIPVLRKLIVEDKNYLIPLNHNYYASQSIKDMSLCIGVVVARISIFRAK